MQLSVNFRSFRPPLNKLKNQLYDRFISPYYVLPQSKSMQVLHLPRATGSEVTQDGRRMTCLKKYAGKIY